MEEQHESIQQCRAHNTLNLVFLVCLWSMHGAVLVFLTAGLDTVDYAAALWYLTRV